MSLEEVLPTYTAEDYLQWEGELWEGHPVAMAPSPTPEHPETKSGTLFQLSGRTYSEIQTGSRIKLIEDCEITINVDGIFL